MCREVCSVQQDELIHSITPLQSFLCLHSLCRRSLPLVSLLPLSLSVFFHLSFTVMMDLRTVLTISLFLMSTESNRSTTETNFTGTVSSTTNPRSDCDCTSPSTSLSTSPTPKSSSAHSLGLLSVRWTSGCDGEAILLLHPPPSSSSLSYSSSLLCQSSLTLVKTLLSSPCESWSGCKGPPVWVARKKQGGYDIAGQAPNTSCKILTLQCTAQTDVQGQLKDQLKAYKVVTALLCCVLLILFLIRFTKPTVRALQSRLSDKRQNRWIGPTQSHSVSYQRGKGVVQSTDVEMRMSYPALERLTVNDSREPSSNRNSGYTF
ncbi:uncharacterized protein [Labrus bergylta]|uniref:uncharacterized protein n=1 Tax=Labrus bergylta TaxID=56723 RepID=UPI003313DABF